MKRVKNLFLIIALILVAKCIIVSPSYADDDDNISLASRSVIDHEVDPDSIYQDIYEGDYTIEDIISKYNVVTLDELKKYNHIVGPVLVKGNLGTEGTTIYHTQQTEGVSSCIGGIVVAGGNANASDGNPQNSNLYVGTKNSVHAEFEGGLVELEENEHMESHRFIINKDASNHEVTPYMTIRTDEYFDFAKLEKRIKAEQALLAGGTVLTPDENGVITVEAGGIYTIETMEGVTKIKINNLQFNDNEQTTLINVTQTDEFTMPELNDENGDQMPTNAYIGEANTMNLVWSIPNASKVTFGSTPFVGHIVAPNTYLNFPVTHSAGCVICKSVSGVEAHYYPFNGKLEIPKKEGKVKAVIKKVDADTYGTVSNAHIQILDLAGNVIDDWTTGSKAHTVTDLIPNGKYILKETVTPQGYTGCSEIRFSVSNTGVVTFDESTPAELSDGTILVKNKLLKTDLTIAKRSETIDGEKLSGAEYILYRTKKGNKITEYYTGVNSDGYATWSTTEDEAAKKVTGPDGIATFTGITIRKSDLDNTTYYFRETKAPKLYKLDSTPIKVTISASDYNEGQAIAHRDQANEKITVEANIIKVDEDTGAAVKGAHIQILDGTKIVDEWDSTDVAHKVTGLYPEKTYILKETVAPQGYKASADKTFTLDVDGHVIINSSTAMTLADGTILVKNKLLTTGLTITKHSETLYGETLKDTDFILYRTKTDAGNKITEYYTGKDNNGVATWSTKRDDAAVKTTGNDGSALFDGITFRVSDIDNMEYFFKEVRPPKLHLIDETPISVKINPADFVEGEVISGADQANEKIGYYVRVTKVDEDTNEPVVGAHIQILDEDGNVIAEWDSTTESHIVKNLVPNKKYILRETVTPQGYMASRDTEFTLNEDGYFNMDKTTVFLTKDEIILIKNKLVTTNIKVTKKDEETGETLADSKYALYRVKDSDGESVIEYYMGKDENGIAMWTEDITKAILMTTNEDGNTKFDGITIRKADLENYTYYVVEKEAPNGYELNDNPIKVKMISSNYMDGVVFEAIEHFNKKIVIPKADPIVEKEVESVSVKTGDNISTYIQIVAIALTIMVLCSKIEIRFNSRM